jgi:hypothetical protein
MKPLLNALFLLSVLVVWCVAPAVAWIAAERAAFSGWMTGVLLVAGVIVAFPLTFAYMMALGVLVRFSEFRRGFRGEGGCGCQCGEGTACGPKSS